MVTGRIIKKKEMVRLIFDTSAPLNGINLDDQKSFTACELRQIAKDHLEQLFGCGHFDFYLLNNGKLVQDKEITDGDVRVIPRLLGGKGGFGSMLRAIGAQIEKTTNREACRDLSGRRLRDINEEKRLKKWIAEQAEREQEALKRKRKKLEKLKEEVNHKFTDEEYTKARLDMPENIHEAVEQGLKASTEEASSSQEALPVAKTNEVAKKKKKKTKGKLWVDDLLSDSETGSESEEEESPSKKIKLS